ncbi:MAG: hypothetical protein AABY22_24560 [Nanoarchaeota archaeon]
MTNSGIEKIMQRNNIKRTSEQLSILNSNANSRENHPNWKEGISKNHYHYTKIQRKRYPEKIKARKKVHYAIKTGKLIKSICEIDECSEEKTFAHHEDYSKPLEVNWLCRKHHRNKHDNKH